MVASSETKAPARMPQVSPAQFSQFLHPLLSSFKCRCGQPFIRGNPCGLQRVQQALFPPYLPLLCEPNPCASVLTLMTRHTCVYVKSAACECLLLFLLRFPLHCDVSAAAPLASASAASLLRSGNARVVKGALQMLDHLLGHSR